MGRRADHWKFTVEDLGAVPGATVETQADARSRNGEYKGDAVVRHLPPGMTGEDFRARVRGEIKAGQIWRRGEQRVRITSVLGADVRFVELTPPGTRRRVPRVQFLRTSHLEVA